jgi:hypothetical protein
MNIISGGNEYDIWEEMNIISGGNEYNIWRE